jgi:hypothetical protein
MQRFDLQILVFSFLIITGIAFVEMFYQNSIQPLELTQTHLDEIVSSSEPETIKSHLIEIKQNLVLVTENMEKRETLEGDDIGKNPVLIFPTESTNFLRIEQDVDKMMATTEKIAMFPKDTSAFHTGMLDINSRSTLLKENIQDAIPYMYGNLESAFSVSIFILGSYGLIQTLWRKQNLEN